MPPDADVVDLRGVRRQQIRHYLDDLASTDYSRYIAVSMAVDLGLPVDRFDAPRDRQLLKREVQLMSATGLPGTA